MWDRGGRPLQFAWIRLRQKLAMSHQIRREDRPGLYCVELRTADWQASVEWYRRVLGLRVLVRVTDDGYALLEAGDTRIALLARTTPGEPSRRVSLAFEVRDLPSLVARLEHDGTPIVHPKHDPEGLREVNTTDPDGNRIRLFCWPVRGR
jgi:catechol 2,3-dioxygenase-like lactoylglutathione lyase family enzyme